jgi:hypothetical protein
MRICDFAIVPCSTILFESLAAKLPVITGYHVDNQKFISDYLVNKNIGLVIGDFNQCHITSKQIMLLLKSKTSDINSMVDGLSGERILNDFLSLN